MHPKTHYLAVARRFLGNTEAAAAIEYAMIAGLLSIAIAGVAVSVGEALVSNYYDKIIGGLTGGEEEN